MVHHDGDPLRVKDPVKAHIPELLKDIGGVDVVEDRLVHPDRHHVAGAQVLRTGVVEQQLLRQGMAGAVGVPQGVPGGGSGQGGLVQRLHPGHQAAVAENVQHLPAEGGDGIGGAVAGELPAHLHLHGVALPAAVVQVPALDQQQAVVDGVAEEDLGKALGDDAADACRLQDGGRHLPGGAAAEVLSGHDGVPRPQPSRQVRPQGLEEMGDHLLQGGLGQVFGHDDDVGVDVVTQPPDAAAKSLFHGGPPLRTRRDCRTVPPGRPGGPRSGRCRCGLCQPSRRS